MSSTVIAGGTIVERELTLMEGGAKYAADFKSQWAARKQTMIGLVRYADALHEITQAGRTGAHSMGKLADSLAGLATSAGVVLPASGLVSVATDAAKMIYQEIAMVRAARSLKSAMVRAQPVVDRITAIIVKDLKAMEELLLLANNKIKGDLKLDEKYLAKLSFRTQLTNEREKLYQKGVSSLSTAETNRLLEIGRLISSADSWYLPLQEQFNLMKKRLDSGSALIAAAAEATMQWNLTHKQIVLTIQQEGKGTINTYALAQAAVQIRVLLNRINEL
jgi:hypothetical protein